MNIPTLSEAATLTKEDILKSLATQPTGLSDAEAFKRESFFGPNLIHKRRINTFSILTRQVTGNPLTIILTLATLVSLALGQGVSSLYIIGMIALSIILGFWNEFSAQKTIEKLLKTISPVTFVTRSGEKKEIAAASLVPGDVILVTEGSIIPADVRFLETNSLEVNESALTGESKLIVKTAAPANRLTANPDHPANIGFMGTSVVNGYGTGVVVLTGKATEFGKIAQISTFLKPRTDFQEGMARFGNLIVKVIFALTLSIFAVNFLLGRPALESLLFALAIAVGLTPELLPVIVTVSLSHGAGKLAKQHVIVKQLIAIENLGNMDILCTDKTGTLTEGEIKVRGFYNPEGKEDNTVFAMAYVCSNALVHHKHLGNSIDVAVAEYALAHKSEPDANWQKIDIRPFDYEKKAMFGTAKKGRQLFLIAKGSPETILPLVGATDRTPNLEQKFADLNDQGYRVVAIGYRSLTHRKTVSWNDVVDLHLAGYLTLLDTPKKSAKEALTLLTKLHVAVKIITGDNELVTAKICAEVGLDPGTIVPGSAIGGSDGEVLKQLVLNNTVFAQVSPTEKLKIIQTLKTLGHTVGYLGDGINDIPSLHEADVGLSVNSADDVAKEAASIVLLRKSLLVIAEGIAEGRKTFNNTIKYILMGTSSNFGNMFSAAGASFFLPFLPMTPVQILLTNGLYDLSQMTIPSDNVDPESLVKPRHWDINFIKNYMLFFGPLSSVYDFLTFGVMLFVFHARNALFQTGWFVESLATEILVIFVIRTARTPFFKSLPGKWVAVTSIAVVIFGFLLPFLPINRTLGFVPLPPLYFLILLILVTTYLLLVETVKSRFLRRYTL
jgi:Mg2+-importing ATPase